MAIDRRSFLVGLGLAAATRAAASPLYVSCARRADGSHRVAAFTGEGRLLFTTALPDRGHDIAARPGAHDLVVFARRPGDWMAVIDRDTGAVRRVALAAQGRRFYGHGAFSADGRLLYATENRIATGDGVLGVYDAGADYVRIGEIPSGGIGPHDVAFLPGMARIVVANGEIRTHPDTGREMLNAGALAPSLALVRADTGEVEEALDLGADLADLSIRHLAVARDGTVAFGCQWAGDPLEAPPLVGLREPSGRLRLFDMPDDDLFAMDNYVGSVALDASGETVCATSPRGALAVFFDRASGRYLGRRRLSDVCGAAAGPGEGTFLLTSGESGAALARVADPDLAALGADLAGLAFDNHALALDAL